MYQRIVVLTGAGISAESGMKTFRAEDGLWEAHRVEDVATPEGYRRDPDLVNRFYNQRWEQLNNGIEPNPAHHALAELEKQLGKGLLVVTQNIDDLHERAGSRRLIHMHGELNKGRCPRSQQVFPLLEPFGNDNLCTCCVPGQVLRPHVVWFGEMPLGLDRIYRALEQCELFISIGTSGTVYPAAGFVEMASHGGADTLEINLEPSEVHSQFSHHQTGRAGELVPKLVEWIKAGNRFS
ncbi:Sir2 family NAD+-dependent deacetylase [Ferrimonas balearica]|nr:Sir2 family NAD+-dependent deacetylase [Ferrimonas balearica]MBY6017115.1 NAD-dependent protein deacylase [Halomonas denitrificans]MBW3138473.1 NAD-dependent protein deacylase [Ferrimonas balearica]MBW3163934.1 NAD-dependent protein deacylase [Ferrimonas balearica]MBY5979243.1 NAD-dependent protein deacylase [Ferrimonas balearica]MBY6105536.1 NAD-dependent protein deacylase [Ferrimonas balearica]